MDKMPTQDLQSQIDEARANGYSEEQIQAFLNPQPVRETALQPQGTGPMSTTTVQTPATPWVDRSAEDSATLQAVGLQAGYDVAKYGLPAAGVGYALKKGIDAYKQTKMPPPTTFTGGANPAFDKALTQPYNPATPQGAPAGQPPVGGPAAAQGATFLERMATMASKYAPAARVATGVGAMVMPGNVGQNYAAQFPQSGPMRGNEINPQTGQPWTAQELQQYSQQYR